RYSARSRAWRYELERTANPNRATPYRFTSSPVQRVPAARPRPPDGLPIPAQPGFSGVRLLPSTPRMWPCAPVTDVGQRALHKGNDACGVHALMSNQFYYSKDPRVGQSLRRSVRDGVAYAVM